MINESIRNPNVILNSMTEIKDRKEFFSLNVPKLVVNNKNYLMYMSRAAIPSSKFGTFEYGLKQVCMYSFPRKDLIKFGKTKKKTFFEYYEDIEILRFLEMDFKVKMVKVSNSSIGVDTLSDVKKVNKILKTKRINDNLKRNSLKK